MRTSGDIRLKFCSPANASTSSAIVQVIHPPTAPVSYMPQLTKEYTRLGNVIRQLCCFCYDHREDAVTSQSLRGLNREANFLIKESDDTAIQIANLLECGELVIASQPHNFELVMTQAAAIAEKKTELLNNAFNWTWMTRMPPREPARGSIHNKIPDHVAAEDSGPEQID